MSKSSMIFPVVLAGSLMITSSPNLNTDGFRFGEDVIIKLPANTTGNIIELFDISGKRLFRASDLPGQDYTLNGKMFAAGVYILRVTSMRGKERQRLVKISDR